MVFGLFLYWRNYIQQNKKYFDITIYLYVIQLLCVVVCVIQLSKPKTAKSV